MDTTVDCLAFNPEDSGAFMTTGPRVLRLWKMHKETEALMAVDLTPKDETSHTIYTHHAWLQEGRVAVTTDDGRILLVSAAQAAVKKVLPAAEDGLGHLEIQAMQHGFITITQSYELLLYEVGGGEFQGPARSSMRIADVWRQNERPARARHALTCP